MLRDEQALFDAWRQLQSLLDVSEYLLERRGGGGAEDMAGGKANVPEAQAVAGAARLLVVRERNAAAGGRGVPQNTNGPVVADRPVFA